MFNSESDETTLPQLFGYCVDVHHLHIYRLGWLLVMGELENEIDEVYEILCSI